MKAAASIFKTLCLTFLVIISVSSKAQSLYELKFTGFDGINYNCFLVFFNESYSYMRIAYQAQNQYNVVHVEYKMENGINGQGKNYSLMRGYSPRFITENKNNVGYRPDFFMWFWDKNSQAGLPYTTDDSTFNVNNYIQVTSYTQLTPSKITEPYLRQFFRSDEQSFFDLEQMCGLKKSTTTTPVTTDVAKNTTLHFVLVANTLDPSIGASCALDETNLRNEFKQIAAALNIGFKEYVFADENNFNKDKVKTALNSLQPASNDIVVFIYRGHGYRTTAQQDDWPMLDIRTSAFQPISSSNGLGLLEVYNILNSKGARLNVILGDCCNSYIDQSPITSNNFMTFQLNNNTDLSKLKKLFIGSKGTILSAAARKGEVSYASAQGGLYTLSFLQALHESISYLNSEQPNWDKLIANTIESAKTKSSPTLCHDCTVQNGIKYTHLVN